MGIASTSIPAFDPSPFHFPAYIIFAVFDFIGVFVIYFFAVETKVSLTVVAE